jgi:hypothetical protein
MKKFLTPALVASVLITAALTGFAQDEKQGQGSIIVTVLPKKEGQTAPAVSEKDMKLKVNGKDASLAKVVDAGNSSLEVVVLIDGSARNSLGREFDEIAAFVKGLPPNAKSAIGYMQNGNTQMAGPLTTDRAATLSGLHLPGGFVGTNASPYFCISDLAKRWPSNDRSARREVIMITDGVDEYNRRYDPDDPYVQAAISDSVKAGMVLYAIYWHDQGRLSATGYENNAGQNLLQQTTQATGGKSFWQGSGNPVSLQPYLEELTRRFKNQYEISFQLPFNGKPQVATVRLKFSSPGSSVDAPQQVFIGRPLAQQE